MATRKMHLEKAGVAIGLASALIALVSWLYPSETNSGAGPITTSGQNSPVVIGNGNTVQQ